MLAGRAPRRAASRPWGRGGIGGGVGAGTRRRRRLCSVGRGQFGPRTRSDPGGPAGASGQSFVVVAAAAAARTGLTRKSRRGGFSTGRMDAATKAASRLESPKNRGRTSAAFSGVMTFASSMTDDKHSRPSRSAASISGTSGPAPPRSSGTAPRRPRARAPSGGRRRGWRARAPPTGARGRRPRGRRGTPRARGARGGGGRRGGWSLRGRSSCT